MGTELEAGARIDDCGRLCIVLARSQIGLRIGPWASGLSVDYLEDKQWLPGDFREEAPLLDWAESDPSVAEFVAGIPESIRERALLFAYHQLPSLRLLCAVPEAETILADNPLLVQLLAGALAAHGDPPHTGRALVCGPRTEILGATTGVRSKAAVRVLARLHYQRVDAADLVAIRNLVAQPALIAVLGRLPSVRGSLLSALMARPDILNLPAALRLLDGTATDSHPCAALWRLISTLRDLERMATDLPHQNPEAAYRACATTDDAERLHNRWIEKMGAQTIADRATVLERRYGTRLLPPPPIVGSDAIVPLRTLDELLAEGQSMRHCAGSYHGKVMSGRTALYAVLTPERATLEVEMLPAGPVVAQLRLFANGVPSQATQIAVQSWLDRAKRALADPAGGGESSMPQGGREAKSRLKD